MECLYYPLSQVGIDRTLSKLRVINSSLFTDSLAIVEPEPYPILTDVGSQWRIVQSFALLPLGTAINRVPLLSFLEEW